MTLASLWAAYERANARARAAYYREGLSVIGPEAAPPASEPLCQTCKTHPVIPGRGICRPCERPNAAARKRRSRAKKKASR